MNKKLLAALTGIASLAAALVGTQYFGSDQWVTVIALAGVTVNQVLTHNTTEDLNHDLRNGTFEKLIRAAIEKIAADSSSSLNVEPTPDSETDSSGTGGGDVNG